MYGWRYVGFFAGSVLLVSTATSAAEDISTRSVISLLEMRQNSVITQEWDLSCGAAALATILRYQYGDTVTEKEVATALMHRDEYITNPELIQARQGFSLLDLKRYAESIGYKGIGYGQMSVEDLIEKTPILTPIDTFGYNHFVIFRGVMADRVLLADPAWGNRTMTVDDFERAWIDYGSDIGRVGFVVVHPDGTSPAGRLAPSANDFVVLN